MATKRDPRKYKWMTYKGRTANFNVTGSDRHSYKLTLEKGERFGIKHLKGYIYLIDESDLSVQFRLEEKDAKRLIDNSAGYEGKISRYRVEPYLGSNKQEETSSKRDIIAMQTDSSAFYRVKYDQKRNKLYVEFKQGAIWVYDKVTPKEYRNLENADSQGRYFIYEIRNIKPQRKIKRMP